MSLFMASMSAKTRRASLSYLRPHAFSILSIAALQVTGVVMQVMSIGMLKSILDKSQSGYGNEYILGEGLKLLVFAIVFSISVYLASRLSSRVAAMVASQIRKDVLASALKVQRLDSAGDSATYTMTCVTSDAMIVQEHVFSSLSIYFPLPILAAAMVWCTYRISTTIGLMVLASMAAVVALTYVFSRHAATFQADRIVGQDMVARSLREKVTGARTIKAYSAQEYERAKFSGVSAFFGEKNKNATLSSYYLPTFTTAFIWIFIVFVYMIAALGMSQQTIRMPHLVMFMQFTTCIVSSLAIIPFICIQAPRARASMERILEVLKASGGEKPKTTTRKESGSALEVCGASFHDGFGRETAGRMDIAVPKGKVVTLTGPIGCGMTELIDCITAFSAPVSGSVAVCGMDVASSDPYDIRCAVSYAGRRSGVFSSTVRSNLDATGALDDARILEICEATGFIEYVRGLPGGLDCILSPNIMSGGQAQLLALTRCLLRDAELYVFDDCFFSMDAKTRAKAVRSILDVRSGKTVLFASHEMTTVGVSDMVFLIDGGRVVGSGTHKELLTGSPLYADMYGKLTGVMRCRGGCSGRRRPTSWRSIPKAPPPRYVCIRFWPSSRSWRSLRSRTSRVISYPGLWPWKTRASSTSISSR